MLSLANSFHGQEADVNRGMGVYGVEGDESLLVGNFPQNLHGVNILRELPDIV